MLRHTKGVNWQAEEASAFLTLMRQIGGVWYRLVFFYSHYPWTLCALVDPRVDRAVRSAVARSFLRKGPCCIGQALVPWQSRVHAAADVDQPWLQKLLQTALRTVRSQTIPVEKLFKQSKTHSSSTSGHLQNLSTICSNHILSTASSLHNQLRDSATAGCGLLNHRGRTAIPKRRESGWNVFVKERMAQAPAARGSGPGGAMMAASSSCKVVWAEATVAQRAKYEERARRESVKKADKAKRVGRSGGASQGVCDEHGLAFRLGLGR